MAEVARSSAGSVPGGPPTSTPPPASRSAPCRRAAEPGSAPARSRGRRSTASRRRRRGAVGTRCRRRPGRSAPEDPLWAFRDDEQPPAAGEPTGGPGRTPTPAAAAAARLGRRHRGRGGRRRPLAGRHAHRGAHPARHQPAVAQPEHARTHDGVAESQRVEQRPAADDQRAVPDRDPHPDPDPEGVHPAARHGHPHRARAARCGAGLLRPAAGRPGCRVGAPHAALPAHDGSQPRDLRVLLGSDRRGVGLGRHGIRPRIGHGHRHL